jgi:hypothetical protein
MQPTPFRQRFAARLMLLDSQRAYYERLAYMFLSYGTHTSCTTPTFITLRKQVKGNACQ